MHTLVSFKRMWCISVYLLLYRKCNVTLHQNFTATLGCIQIMMILALNSCSRNVIIYYILSIFTSITSMTLPGSSEYFIRVSTLFLVNFSSVSIPACWRLWYTYYCGILTLRSGSYSSVIMATLFQLSFSISAAYPLAICCSVIGTSR